MFSNQSETLSQFQRLSSSGMYSNNHGNMSLNDVFGQENENQGNSVFHDSHQQNGMFFQEQKFATPENMTHSLANLNQRLLSLGIINQPMGFDSVQGQVLMLNGIYKLLGERQENIQMRDDMGDKMSRLQCDYRNVSNNYSKCKKELDQSKRTIAQQSVKYKNKLSESTKEIRQLANTMNKTKLEAQAMQQKQVQYEHKIHRQEAQIEKLKERISKLVHSKGGVPAKFSILNQLPTEGKRDDWKHGRARNENTLYQNVVAAYEDEKKEVVQENTALRESLIALNKQLNQLRRVFYAQQGITKFESHVNELKDGQFSLPFDIVRDEIESTLHEKVQEIQQVISKFESTEQEEELAIRELHRIVLSEISSMQAAKNAKDIVEQLQNRFMRYQALLQEQAKLLTIDLKQPTRNLYSQNQILGDNKQQFNSAPIHSAKKAQSYFNDAMTDEDHYGFEKENIPV